jgi:hypothetical protein
VRPGANSQSRLTIFNSPVPIPAWHSWDCERLRDAAAIENRKKAVLA